MTFILYQVFKSRSTRPRAVTEAEDDDTPEKTVPSSRRGRRTRGLPKVSEVTASQPAPRASRRNKHVPETIPLDESSGQEERNSTPDLISHPRVSNQSGKIVPGTKAAGRISSDLGPDLSPRAAHPSTVEFQPPPLFPNDQIRMLCERLQKIEERFQSICESNKVKIYHLSHQPCHPFFYLFRKMRLCLILQ